MVNWSTCGKPNGLSHAPENYFTNREKMIGGNIYAENVNNQNNLAVDSGTGLPVIFDLAPA